MTILVDKEIRKLLEEKKLIIKPPPEPHQIQPASLDVRLGREFLFFDKKEIVLDPLDKNSILNNSKLVTTDKYIIIEPGEFVLARTLEYIVFPKNIAGYIMGRSSIGRLGLFVENAGWIDPGFEGTLTLELVNASSHKIKLYPGMRIAQLIFFKLSDEPELGYSERKDSKYKGQILPTISKIFEDLEFKTKK